MAKKRKKAAKRKPAAKKKTTKKKAKAKKRKKQFYIQFSKKRSPIGGRFFLLY